MTDRLAAAVRQAVGEGNQLPCSVAFKIAGELEVTPLQVGEMADELGIRLSHCQLGLFGYGPKSEGKHRIVCPMSEVPADLRSAIEEALVDGRLPCAAAWEIAARFRRPRLDIANAAEGLGVRINRCQLGAF